MTRNSNGNGSPTSRPAAYFTLRKDRRTVGAVRGPLFLVAAQHRAEGGFVGDLGVGGHFFVSFVAVEACDQFERELRRLGIWYERTRECPVELKAARMTRGAVCQRNPEPFFAVLVVEVQ